MIDANPLLNALDRLAGVRKKTLGKEHKLKWKLPEARLSFPLQDAEETVGLLEKKVHAKFLGGGEYSEVVHAKQFGEGVFSYLLVRTDRKTEEETVVAETYMVQEEEKLGLEVTSAYKMMEDLQELGYEEALAREYTVWRFASLEIPLAAFSIEEFGDFLEVALPATNFVHQRERSEKRAYELVAKLGLKKEDAIPTDVITLQMAGEMEKAQKGKGRR
ncbi:hypothetical protein HY995_04015 [Candidatus Micrarchaeota archaeon]|nr:hypothetical protein [Candidatus Micrarchaeota archaeon]MBI5177223.1 hypothetical protein [Candidatus Micrarchaeota archaeon]